MGMPRSGLAGALTCTPSACSRSITSFQLEPSEKAPCTRTTVGWVPSCGFSLTPSSLVEEPEAELLLRLAPLCEGAEYTPSGDGASPDGPVRVNVSLDGPRISISETSENGASRRLGE